MLIQHLSEFKMLAECKNFTHAANQLFISQPTLSKHIVQLEEELQVKLFERNKKEVSLTPAGYILLRSSNDIIDIYNQTLSDLSALSKETIGKLRIDVFLYGIKKYVYPITNLIKDNYPKVQLDISSPHPLEPIINLESGQTDIAQIFRYPNSDLESYSYIDICPSRFCIGMPFQHPLTQKEKIYIKDLENETFIFNKTVPEFNLHFKNYLKSINFRIKEEIMVDTVDTMFVMAENYNVIAPMQSINLDPNYRKNVFKYIEDSDESVKIAFAWKKDNCNPCINAFRQAAEMIFPQSL